MVAKFGIALVAALASAPAWAGDAPRLTAMALAAQEAPAKSGDTRYCRPIREIGESQGQLRCATRAQWRVLGVTVAKR